VPRPFPLDLIVLSQGEVDEQLATGSHFFRDILAQGRVLYERPACCHARQSDAQFDGDEERR
jgi:hypothetical protein